MNYPDNINPADMWEDIPCDRCPYESKCDKEDCKWEEESELDI